MNLLTKTIYISFGVVAFIMAATTAGIGAKRQRSDKKTCANIGAGEGEDFSDCGRYTPDFFNMGTDLAGITWAHAVNSKTLLDNALRDKKIMMLEADVIIGTLPCDNSVTPITSSNGCDSTEYNDNNGLSKTLPVMGHPPATNSDLSLETLLTDLISHNRGDMHGGPKGLKLDFKTIEAFEASLPILSEYYPKVEFPLWLNADILPGPGEDNDRVPVDPQRFLSGAASFPASKLSLGWTTRYCKDYPDAEEVQSGAVTYSKQQMTDMLTLLATTVTNRNVTFPVRAGIAANCSELMLLLLSERPTYTLTIWSADKDYVDTAKLNALLQEAGNDRFYLDVPKSVAEKLKCRKKPSRSAARLLANIGIVGATLLAIALVYFNKISLE